LNAGQFRYISFPASDGYRKFANSL